MITRTRCHCPQIGWRRPSGGILCTEYSPGSDLPERDFSPLKNYDGVRLHFYSAEICTLAIILGVRLRRVCDTPVRYWWNIRYTGERCRRVDGLLSIPASSLERKVVSRFELHWDVRLELDRNIEHSPYKSTCIWIHLNNLLRRHFILPLKPKSGATPYKLLVCELRCLYCFFSGRPRFRNQ
ncbi:hypothetical protein SCHPADRAFT_691750 [Schizopora paradoxa]|uniref:Uncharacterized protein n=1 Tax=Schizopora paradoxa TaxID=27342 RepID=A0A0H2RA59_9AGAM|nr:hypothetical protein SCHPADRAFT_691750 [Schizopora paradoxa]